MSLDSQIDALRTELAAAIAAATDDASLDAVRVAALGKKGSVSALLASLGSMAPEERKSAGPAINGLKNEIAGLIETASAALKGAALEARLKAETVDITLPLQPAPTAQGRIHPISQTLDEITAIFSDMGFSIAEGPDIETDYFNFTALNFPEGHPAREMHDTFFMKPGPDGVKKLLRTHTSPVQMRVMQVGNEKPAAGFSLPICMTRICTGEVCVRSSFFTPSGPGFMKKVSCISRAGWPSGKLSAVKLK